MKKTNLILLFLAVILTFSANAQVKIGSNPNSIGTSSVLELESTNKALVLTRVANTSAISSPVNGMIVYDQSATCLKTYDNGEWSACLNRSSQSVSVVSSAFSGAFYSNIALFNGIFSITLKNESFATVTVPLATSNLVLSGISGYTVSSVSASSLTIAPGDTVTAQYTITGTASSIGTLTGSWSVFSLKSIATQAVTNALPSIASLNCSSTVSSPAFAVQGVYYSGTFTIPYTGGNGASYSGMIFTSTGITGLTATLRGGNLALNAGGNLVFDVSGTTNVTGSSGYTPSGNTSTGANFSFTFGGRTCTYALVVIPNFSVTFTKSAASSGNGSVDYSELTSPSNIINSGSFASSAYHNSSTSKFIFPYQGSYRITYNSTTVTVGGNNGVPEWHSVITSPASTSIVSGNSYIYYKNGNGNTPLTTRDTYTINQSTVYDDNTGTCNGCCGGGFCASVQLTQTTIKFELIGL